MDANKTAELACALDKAIAACEDMEAGLSTPSTGNGILGQLSQTYLDLVAIGIPPTTAISMMKTARLL